MGSRIRWGPARDLELLVRMATVFGTVLVLSVLFGLFATVGVTLLLALLGSDTIWRIYLVPWEMAGAEWAKANPATVTLEFLRSSPYWGDWVVQAYFVALPVVIPVVLMYVAYRYGQREVLAAASARTVTAEQRPDLHARVSRLAKQVGLPNPDVAVVPHHGPRSFAVGRAGNGTVAVTEGLLDELDGDQLDAVLAHELSHLANRDALLLSIAAAVPIAIDAPFDDGPADLEDAATESPSDGGDGRWSVARTADVRRIQSVQSDPTDVDYRTAWETDGDDDPADSRSPTDDYRTATEFDPETQSDESDDDPKFLPDGGIDSGASGNADDHREDPSDGQGNDDGQDRAWILLADDDQEAVTIAERLHERLFEPLPGPLTEVGGAFTVLLAFLELYLALGAVFFFLVTILYVIAVGIVAYPVWKPIEVLCAWSAARLSRYREYSADRGAVAITGDPAALASALATIEGAVEPPTEDYRSADAIQSLAILPYTHRYRIRTALGPVTFETHPPVGDRLDRLEQLAREQAR